MFEISKYRLTESTIPIIVDNYEILHFDEFPILYIGTNIFGNKIIGTLADEVDDEVYLFRYFHTIVTNSVYSRFLNKEITYLEILSNSKTSFVLDKDINGKISQVFQITISEIPKEYMPSASSFCPDYGNILINSSIKNIN